MHASNLSELDAFLESRNPIDSGAAFGPGDVFGDWRITAFIGKGGNGEVYRVEHTSLGTVAALKVLMRESAAEHFHREARLLSELKQECFPRIYSFGEAHGHLYCAMELLEPMSLPNTDSEVAEFIVSVAEAVSLLHQRGLVHRDVKPKNVLRRGRQTVLIDFGLVERAGTPISKCQGTLVYAAPEQFAGGETSFAVDIHALGVMANGCFDGKPPREWEKIINRATSSIPDRRYADAAGFICAVKRRHFSKWILRTVSALLIIGGIAVYAYLWWRSGGEEAIRWRSLCHESVTNLVTRELVDVKYETRTMGPITMKVPVKWIYRIVTNELRETVVDLGRVTNRFDHPVRLAPGNYRVVGPGVLRADIIGSNNVTMRLDKCVVQNQTETLPPDNQVHYIVNSGTYLNFARISESVEMNKTIEVPDRHNVEVRFRGPAALRELREIKRKEYRQSRIEDEYLLSK